MWSDKASVTYRSNLVNEPLLDHSWEPELAGTGRGNTVNVFGFTQNNAARSRTSTNFGTGAAVTFDANTEGQTQIVVNRWYYKAYRFPVELEPQFTPSYLGRLTDGAGKAVALQEDADIASDSTNGYAAFVPSVGTDNVDIVLVDLLTHQTNLDNANADKTDRFLVVSPASLMSMLQIEEIRNSLYGKSIGNLDAGNKTAGYQGQVLNFGVYESNNLAAGTAGKKNAAFQREAIAYIGQIKLAMKSILDIVNGTFMEYITYKTCGFKIMKTTFGDLALGK